MTTHHLTTQPNSLLPLAMWVLFLQLPESFSDAAAAETPDFARQYARALVQEAVLEDALRSLRAAVRYAESTGAPSTDAQRCVGQGEDALAKVRALLRVEAPSPSPPLGDVTDALATAAAAARVAKASVSQLQTELRARLGPWEPRPPFTPLAPLSAAGRANLTAQFVFTGLAPQAKWPGWTAETGLQEVLHTLGVQAFSPWFG